jgi:hypothetical protein
MSYTEGQLIYLGGDVYHIHLDPNGPSYDPATGQRYEMVPGFPKPDQHTVGNLPPANNNPTVDHGPVVNTPTVPGGHDHPGKGVTVVNIKAMKKFAENISGLVADGGPLKKALAEMDTVNVRAGGFHSAVALAKVVNGPNGMQGGTKQTLVDMVQVLTEISDAVAKLANHYETAEELNALSSADYATYLGTVSGYVNGMGGGQQ